MVKFEVKKRFSGELRFIAEIDCDESLERSKKLGLSIKWAIKNKIDLSSADLSGADLSGADLSGADLSGAYLSGAYLSDADLSSADLSGADLSGADLRDADLSGAYLSGAYLRDADLSGAYLRDADLRGADLRDADLRGADLHKNDLRIFRHDFWCVLLTYPDEIPGLIEYIKDGKIDGSYYSGDCCCLMGSIAKISHKNIEDGSFSMKDSKSPIERWFMMISQGDTPENSFASKMVLEWAEEFQRLWNIRSK